MLKKFTTKNLYTLLASTYDESEKQIINEQIAERLKKEEFFCEDIDSEAFLHPIHTYNSYGKIDKDVRNKINIKLEKQLKKKELDLDDYLMQLRQVKKMGSFSSLLKMIPGMNQIKDLKVDDKEFVKIEAIICSMTKAEKRDTRLLNASRRQRIAKRKWNNSTRY